MIGERLYDLRIEAGLSQTQLGEILNVNKHSISAYERDKNEPPDAIKIKIARYFHVSVDYLTGMTDNPASPADGEYVRVPPELPKEALCELEIFMDYLKYKYKYANKEYSLKLLKPNPYKP